MESESERSIGSDSGFDESSRWSCMSRSSSDLSSPATMGWAISKPSMLSENDVSDMKSNKKSPLILQSDVYDDVSVDSEMEMEMMKERFSKLLLGEDMSGSGNGVCPALTLSNAITNLYATVFGQLWKLEPLRSERKAMWKREMGWFLCVADYIVEMVPSCHTSPDGNRVEVMSSRPRLDLDINLPALRKLDNMLLEILDGFTETEFWYIDQGIGSQEVGKSVSFRKAMERQEEKWWLPVPRVPTSGLSEGTRNDLTHKLESASQILKAVSAINSSVLADMEIPKSYLDSLPKTGRACLGDVIYRYITSEQFSPDCLLTLLNLSSDHAALELANRVESAIYVWIRRLHSKHSTKESSHAKSSWEIVKDLVQEGDKRGLLVERAKNLLRAIKQRYPGLSQTTLDTSKIQENQDVGKSILESYSRVLESLTFSIMARIEDLLYVDDSHKHKVQSSAALTPLERAHVTPNISRVKDEVKDSGLVLDGPGPALRGASEGTLGHAILGRNDSSSSVDSETKPKGLDRYYMYSSLR